MVYGGDVTARDVHLSRARRSLPTANRLAPSVATCCAPHPPSVKRHLTRAPFQCPVAMTTAPCKYTGPSDQTFRNGTVIQ
ncbi:unnamed protein product, partial [Iphiclides podalirius]